MSGSPIPVINLIASVTWIEPIDAQSTPSTPPSAQLGTMPGGGGSGYYAGTVTLVETFSGANGSDVRTRSYDPGGGIKQPSTAGDSGIGLGISGNPGLIVIQRNGP